MALFFNRPFPGNSLLRALLLLGWMLPTVVSGSIFRWMLDGSFGVINFFLQGLGLLHGHSVWVADTPEAFAAGVATLMADPERRAQIARAAHNHVLRQFDWRAIAEKQRNLLRDILAGKSG